MDVEDIHLNYLLMLKGACKSEMVKLTKAEWDGLNVFDSLFLIEHEIEQQERFKEEHVK